MTDLPLAPALFPDTVDEIDRVAKRYDDELVALRRDLHRHPELGGAEVRTTRILLERLRDAGITADQLATGTGAVAEIVGGQHRFLPGTPGRTVVLRADIDALPLVDEKDVPYRSTVPGVCHACGHDVHTAVVLGAGLVLGELAREGLLPGNVRLIFQPAEEVMHAGAEQVLATGVLDGVERAFAVHCDPREVVGKVGLRVGGVTASADQVTVRLHGPGGHTARPHLTADIVYALADLATRLPAALSRRIDPRAGLSLVWGRIDAGTSPNVIPDHGVITGTVRSLDTRAWDQAQPLVERIAREIVAPYGVTCEVEYVRGVPPVVNERDSVAMLAAAARSVLGSDGVRPTEQSLGGEDFAWFVEKVPGALLRLGVRAREEDLAADLHRGDFDVDERAIAMGVRVMAAAAILALA